jgi:hypothetical protein
VNTSYKVFELEYLLRQSDSKMLVMTDGYKDSNYVDIINELCPRLKNTKPGILINPLLPGLQQVVYAGRYATPPGMIGWHELSAAAQEVEEESAACADRKPVSRRGHQLAVHFRNDRFSQGRYADPPQHRQQWPQHR